MRLPGGKDEVRTQSLGGFSSGLMAGFSALLSLVLVFGFILLIGGVVLAIVSKATGFRLNLFGK